MADRLVELACLLKLVGAAVLKILPVMVVVVRTSKARTLGNHDFVVLQQDPRMSRVLGSDKIDIFQNFERAERDVAKISDWRGDNIEAGRQGSGIGREFVVASRSQDDRSLTVQCARQTLLRCLYSARRVVAGSTRAPRHAGSPHATRDTQPNRPITAV